MNFKRVIRDLKKAPLKNLSLVLLIILSVMIIISFSRSSFSFLETVNLLYEQGHVEDGQFTLQTPLTHKQQRALSNRFHMTLEQSLSQDEEFKNPLNKKSNNITIRLIQSVRQINQPQLIKGKNIESTYDILLDSKFAIAQGYDIGDTLTICGCTFTITGFGISPDYIYTLEQPADLMNSPDSFGVAYLSKKGFDKIQTDKAMTSTYSYIGDKVDHDALQKFLQDRYVLINYMTRHDNSRIEAVFNDAQTPIYIAIIMGSLLLIMIAFILSISIKNTITNESQTIGILYAQGFIEKELLRYYMIIPLLFVAIGTSIGYLLGVILSKYLLQFETAQYTVPPIILRDSATLIGIGIILPFILTLSITYISIRSALNKTPLSLLRGMHSNKSVTKLEKHLQFKHLSFFPKFRIKNMLREKGSMLALFFGALLSIFILSTAMHMKDSSNLYMNRLITDVPYSYLYSFNSEHTLYQYQKQGELTTIKSLKSFQQGKNRNISVHGIEPDSAFFKCPDLNTLKEGEVLISPCLAQKYNIHIGDQIILQEPSENKNYSVTVKAFAPYDYGAYLYLYTSYFNRLFNLHQRSYNALLTDHALKVPSHLLLTSISKQDMASSMVPMTDMVNGLTNVMLAGSTALLVIVIYILLKMIIDKSQINISMVKIFGYTPAEVNKLYLKGHFLFLALGYILGIPAGYYMSKVFYDSVFESMDKYFLPSITPSSLLFAFIAIVSAYLIAILLLKRNLNHVALCEALKNRE